jgi:plastocyanin
MKRVKVTRFQLVLFGLRGVILATLAAIFLHPAISASIIAATNSAPTFDIHGTVSIDPAWDLQKPNLSRVVVYLDSAPALDAIAPSTQPAVMAQENKAFNPDLLVISLGQSVEFPNWDHFEHNVFSLSAAAPAFDLDRYSYGQAKDRTFNKTGIIQLFCNIHPDMRGIICVTPNTFFARADAHGKFTIPHVPAGSWKLLAWSERCSQKAINVTAGSESAAIDVPVVLHSSRDAIIANAPPAPRQPRGTSAGLSIKRQQLDLPVAGGLHPATEPPPDAHSAHN